MTLPEMQQALRLLASDYEANPRYMSEKSLNRMLNDYAELYRYFLRGRLLYRLIMRKELCVGHPEESRALANELTSPLAFLDEAQYTLSILEEYACLTWRECL